MKDKDSSQGCDLPFLKDFYTVQALVHFTNDL
jgi:hypothetical protein